MKAGDAILYVPHADHALTKGPDGNYPWELGWRDRKGQVTPLAGKHLQNAMMAIHRAADPAKKRAKLVLLKPRCVWHGTVTQSHGNGTADLDVQSHHGGVTLHLSQVPFDQTGKTPHSFHITQGP